MQDVARQLNYHSPEDLLAALGYGEESVTLVINRLQDLAGQTRNHTKVELQTKKTSEVINTAIIAGEKNLRYHFAKCCNPNFGDAVIGIIKIIRTCGESGISIHRQDCPDLKQVNHNRKVLVRWPVDIQIKVVDRPGVLKDILNLSALSGMDVKGCYVDTSPEKVAVILGVPLEQRSIVDINLKILVSDHEQLQFIINQIKDMDDVVNVCCLNQELAIVT
jgi:(p)ppGpp synthase/HD superfamily hydrolase